jgi:hypothetical protein
MQTHPHQYQQISITTPTMTMIMQTGECRLVDPIVVLKLSSIVQHFEILLILLAMFLQLVIDIFEIVIYFVCLLKSYH